MPEEHSQYLLNSFHNAGDELINHPEPYENFEFQ